MIVLLRIFSQSHLHVCVINLFDLLFSRKEQLSSKFHRRHLLSRCLRAWKQWVKSEQEQRQLKEEHSRKTQKMAALLEAAATGRLWSERGGKTGMGLELEDIEDELAVQSSSTARKVVRVTRYVLWGCFSTGVILNERFAEICRICSLKLANVRSWFGLVH